MFLHCVVTRVFENNPKHKLKKQLNLKMKLSNKNTKHNFEMVLNRFRSSFKQTQISELFERFIPWGGGATPQSPRFIASRAD